MAKILTIISLSFFTVFFISNVALATGILPKATGLCPDGTTNCGAYTLNDMVSVLANVATFILGIVGSLALLMFTYGGVTFLLSGGNSEKVQKGQQILIGSVIGLAIVFTSFTIITFAMSALGITDSWWVSSWFE